MWRIGERRARKVYEREKGVFRRDDAAKSTKLSLHYAPYGSFPAAPQPPSDVLKRRLIFGSLVSSREGHSRLLAYKEVERFPRTSLLLYRGIIPGDSWMDYLRICYTVVLSKWDSIRAPVLYHRGQICAYRYYSQVRWFTNRRYFITLSCNRI